MLAIYKIYTVFLRRCSDIIYFKSSRARVQYTIILLGTYAYSVLTLLRLSIDDEDRIVLIRITSMVSGDVYGNDCARMGFALNIAS